MIQDCATIIHVEYRDNRHLTKDRGVPRMSKLVDLFKERTNTLLQSEGSFAYAEGYEADGEAKEDTTVETAAPASVAAQIMVLDHITRADATKVADHIGGNRLVVLDMAETPKEDRLRILDFLSGYMYSEQGRIAKINSHAYIAVPSFVDIYGATEEDESLFSQLTAAFAAQAVKDNGATT